MANDVYQNASLQLLVPEDRTEPVITPWQIFAHTHGFNATSQAIRNYFAQQKVLVEAHMSFPLMGRPIQMQYLDRQADAQGRANGFRIPSAPGKLLGAISCESEDKGNPKLPYSREQVEDQGLFWAHCSMRYWIPLNLISEIDEPGISYHARFKANNPNSHACPSGVRIEQLPDIINVAKWFVAVAKQSDTAVVSTVNTEIGQWKVQRDGGVLTVKGPFLGSYPGLRPADRAGDPNRRFKTAYPRTDGGYTLISEADERYDFPYPPHHP